MNRAEKRFEASSKRTVPQLRGVLHQLIEKRKASGVDPTMPMRRIENTVNHDVSKSDLMFMIRQYRLEIELMANRVKMENGG